jgi:threonine synthase
MSAKSVRCRQCNTEFAPEDLGNCANYQGILEVIYDYDKINLDVFHRNNSLTGYRMWQYKELLPLTNEKNIVSLGEEGTPLIEANNLNVSAKAKYRILLKLENQNPSSSFKDRPTLVAISKAKKLKAQTVIVSSSGNAAMAGMKCVICIPRSTDVGKVSQAVAHGA